MLYNKLVILLILRVSKNMPYVFKLYIIDIFT
jgi:hypothetical protein